MTTLRPNLIAVSLVLLLSGCAGVRTGLPTSSEASVQSAMRAPAGSQTIWSWGVNHVAQLGDGGTTNEPSPVQVATSGISGITAITGGGAHGMLVTSAGQVWTWGWNAYGQLGVGSTTGPQLCMLKTRNTACARTPVEVGSIANVRAIAAGDLHSLAITTNDTVWAWGDNQDGQLGAGFVTSTGCLCIDAPVKALLPTGIVSLAGGGRHSLALRNDGTVYAFGLNQDGQLGDGTLQTRPNPTLVASLPYTVAVAAGYYHSLAITNTAHVYAWGQNTKGELGNGSTQNSDVPVETRNLTNVRAISGGGEFSMALRSDGTVWTWGSNAQGQLGIGSTVSSSVPVQVKALQNVVAIMAGHKHALAIDSQGSVWAWGENTDGELGNGTTTESLVPVRSAVQGAPTTLGSGDQFSLAF